MMIQYGQGIGSFFQNLYHLISPWISSGLNAIKSEASNASKKIIQDIASKPITNLITEHGTEAIKNLKRKAINKMQGGG